MEKLMVATITGNLDKGQREVLKADMEAQLGPGYRVLLVPQGVAVNAAHWPATVSEPGKTKPLPEITPQPRTEGETPIPEPRAVGKMVIKLDVSEFKDALAQARAQVEEEIAKAKADRVNRDVLLMVRHADHWQVDGRPQKDGMVKFPYRYMTATQQNGMPRVWRELDESGG